MLLDSFYKLYVTKVSSSTPLFLLQLSFLSAPQLGFSLSGLGGIELSSVPYAFQWVNSSMHYVLEQVRI